MKAIVMMKRFFLAATVVLCGLSTPAVAQQAGTADYNRVYLPGHGVGDTVSGRIFWGAIAFGDERKTIGFALNQPNRRAAVKAALRECSANGGRKCVPDLTFYNACAVIAMGPGRTKAISNDAETQTLESLREEVMDDCGSDCRIVRQGCATGQ
ncbi:DUF4189 domain-containing protein [Stenotrophomonas sp.]|uniref:DUF4189 domain-containing protein n=1 Tax=Stenotrophomonas sp. TaxID=69392 RepID=UPI002FC60015